MSASALVESELFVMPQGTTGGRFSQTWDGEHAFCLAGGSAAGWFYKWDALDWVRLDDLTLQPDGSPCVLSPNGAHVGLFAMHDGGWHIGVDGVLRPESARVATEVPVSVSNDGRVAYAVQHPGGVVLVVDGEPVGDAPPLPGSPAVFSDDGKRIAFVSVAPGGAQGRVVVDGTAGPNFDNVASSTIGGEEVWSFQFSPDGRRYAYGARRGKKWLSALDGDVGREWDGISWASFNATGDRYAYAAQDGSKWTIVVNGEPGPFYDKVGPPIFSPDGTRLAYATVSGGKHRMVLDGAPGPESDGIHWEDRSAVANGYGFSPDSRRFVYLSRQKRGFLHGSSWSIVLDGNGQGSFDDVGPSFASVDVTAAAGQPRFSPDGNHLAVAVKQGDDWHVALDGSVGPGYHLLFRPVFSDQGNRLAYVAKPDKKHASVVVDETAGPRLDDLVSRSTENPRQTDDPVCYFTRDGAHLAYTGQTGERLAPFVDGAAGNTYSSVSFPVPTADDGMRWLALRDGIVYAISGGGRSMTG